MRIFNRGATIHFTHIFYDSSGDVTSPSSARLTLNFCTTGFPYRGERESTYVTLTQNTTTLAWEGDWPSARSGKGTVFWNIQSDDLTLAVEDGQLDLRANPANLSITSTT